MTVHSKGGALTCTCMADFPGYPKPVWYDRRAITNIISFAQMADHFWIEHNNRSEDAFFVHKHNGDMLKFVRSKCGIYCHNLVNRQVCFNQTVLENSIGYTKREQERALEARRSCNEISFPSARDCKLAVKANSTRNCPVD